MHGHNVGEWARIVDALDVGVVIQNVDATITYANDKAISLLGLTREEVLGRNTRDPRWNVIDPDGEPVLEAGHPAIRALLSGEAVRDVVLGVYRPRSDDRIWITASALPERDDAGAVTRAVVTFTDISVAQRSALELESRYRSVIRAMSEGVVIHNPDGSIRLANAAAERTLGVSLAQMQGRSPLDPRWHLIRPDGQPAGPEDIPSEITRLTGLACERTLLGVHRPNGERAWLIVSTDPVREPGSDALTAVVATFTDVTAERATKLALEESQRRVQQVLDAVPGVVFQFLRLLNGRDRLTFVGGRVEELLGVTIEALDNDLDRLLDVAHKGDRAGLRAALDAAVLSSSAFEHVIRVEHGDAGTRWLKAHSVPVRTDEGLLYTGVILDVTEEQRMADALQRTQRREAMASLAAGIAHNFNNMLAVLLPNLQLAMPNVSQDVRMLLTDAEQAARRASELVGQMLTVGRASAEDATRTTVDLVPLMREALHICRNTFDRGITIVDRVDMPTAYVRGSASHLQQVVLNLCLNARDAMEGYSERTLEISLSADGNDVLLMVSDTGAGMSEETLRHLGEPFFTTKAAGSGTGLGLASAFHTITEAGGSWIVSSSPGGGTVFVLRFPLDKPPEEDAEGKRAAPKLENSARVLVVDDEEMVRRALGRMLAHAGFSTILVDDGATALQLIAEDLANKSQSIDAVLLDLSMPGMAGGEVLARIVSLVPELPTIVMSGHVADPGALRGANAILYKPVSQDELVATLTAAVGSNGAAH